MLLDNHVAYLSVCYIALFPRHNEIFVKNHNFHIPPIFSKDTQCELPCCSSAMINEWANGANHIQLLKQEWTHDNCRDGQNYNRVYCTCIMHTKLKPTDELRDKNLDMTIVSSNDNYSKLTEITQSTTFVFRYASAISFSFVSIMAVTCSGANICLSSK